MKDSLEKWYKRGFDNLNVIVPFSIWKNIIESISKWPANWYKTNANDINIETPKNAWEDISKKLVVLNQTKHYNNHVLFKASAIAFCFLLIPLTTHNYSYESRSTIKGNENQHFVTPLIADNTKTIDSSTSDIINSINKDIVTSKISEGNNQQLGQLDQSNNQLSEQQLNKTIVRTIIASDVQPKLESINSELTEAIIVSDLEYRRIGKSLGFNPSNELAHYNDNSKSSAMRSKWMIGGKVSANSTSLITPLIYQTTSSESSLNGKSGYSLSYGVSSIYVINSRSSMSFDFMMNDKKSFAVFDLGNSNSLRRRTQFSFTTFSGLYKRKLIKSFKNEQHHLNAGMGLFGSIRTQLNEYSDNPSFISFIDNYKKYDAGLNLGVDYSFDITKSIRLFTGLQYQLGVINLFNGTKKVPESTYKTRTSALGFNIAMYYKL